MPVSRIEKIDTTGSVVQRAGVGADGKYRCFPFGKNVDPVLFGTLDEVADFLRKNPKAGVRMNPGWSKISKCIHIDGVPL
jgi:hypothetical protein